MFLVLYRVTNHMGGPPHCAELVHIYMLTPYIHVYISLIYLIHVEAQLLQDTALQEFPIGSLRAGGDMYLRTRPGRACPGQRFRFETIEGPLKNLWKVIKSQED